MTLCSACQGKEVQGVLCCNECMEKYAALVFLNVLNMGEIVPLSGFSELSLGRACEGQDPLPDIDLAPFQAYEAGVSRLHAAIKMSNQHFTIEDLGSANGTRLNGKRIVEHTPYPLQDGDILTLGKLKIQILFRPDPDPYVS